MRCGFIFTTVVTSTGVLAKIFSKVLGSPTSILPVLLPMKIWISPIPDAGRCAIPPLSGLAGHTSLPL